MTHDMTQNIHRLNELTKKLSHKPSTDDLWALHGPLLACIQDEADAQLAYEVVREFHLYLSELQSKMTARQYNELASRLDIASVGVLALQDILIEQEHLGKSVLLGSIGEGLMVLASRQYIKAWEQELKSVHRRAAWTIYGVLWQLSCRYRPEMPSGERQVLIESLLAPALDDDTPFDARMLVLLRLFQTATLLLLAPLCAPKAQ